MTATAHFWPHGWAEWVTVGAAFTVVGPLAVLLFRWIGTPQLFVDPAHHHYLKLLEWERDRVLGVAKGTGASAAGFLAVFAMAMLKQEIKADVSGFSLLGCLSGAVGLLVFAARMNAGTRIPAAPKRRRKAKAEEQATSA
ncbi:hypothetical protein [Amycolatopsis benzoatilytica]|uniref:hypothetical protein n=1 Tax=Amycolatopsis benzoatilytica TaxID=346045 RepID=UPI0003824AAD|nr:hypothetical protein [Amycolatopsis benzoatilytica]